MRGLIVFFAGMLGGAWIGFLLGARAVMWCVKDGRFSRRDMDKILRMWRGPDGEAW